ncbi:hypothetical protein HL667_24465 [Bradyrhizobium sp. 83012]|uniref:Transposase n=1 Tax=Bradyrhizobium aeschynomenes TaxID=2734909 RepID=A0ABX2CIY5_9BRAD|nr:hypothetical protein [Bradyrhizobium aeschynomenes]NPU11092.1 hypothetical protein [Bradyrhizobium aeschynomenes]NPU68178.1 hypothetical protein [Bradyrhizobium aeschynomenes]
MDFLNHLVAARLMKTAEGFQRIGAHRGFRRLSGPGSAAASSRPAVGLVVDNSAARDPALTQICPERDGCGTGL